MVCYSVRSSGSRRYDLNFTNLSSLTVGSLEVEMIEVVASMARGPVFLAGELLECLITFTNPMSHLSTSASR
ncbi:hypothetical protein ILYODFUR_023263 [Ilyodon furcidens]|uniref:Uncharacterized protein n=1 Tax=Ilyodon furcidens TaxID=33524 RepID=A0ABV0UWQ6_9TELE